MRLDRIEIKNFKGLRFAEFRPASFGCLVGENNAGKSSVLQAIVAALKREQQIPTTFYYDALEPIEFKSTFSEIGEADLLRLSEEHRSKIVDLIRNGELTIVVRYRPSQRCETLVLKRSAVDSRYREETVTATLAGKRPPAVHAAVREYYPEFIEGLETNANITAAKAFLFRRIAELDAAAFELTESPLPTGMPASITDFLPEPIYIPAVKNLHDDLKTSQSTSFGRLLGLLLDGMRPDLDQIKQSLTELERMLNRVELNGEITDQRHHRVRDLERRIEGYLRSNFPAIKLELSVPPPELRTILNGAQLLIDDGSRDLIDNKGDGIKRSLTFAILQAFVASRHDASHQQPGGEDCPAPRPLLFLFEEPELYLHPRSQRILFNTLAEISAENQVVVTTHSPLFFAPGVTASLVRVVKEPETPKPIGRLYPINFSLEADNAEVFRLARFESADAAFFSRRVVLIEGESDDTFLKHVAKLLRTDWCFDTQSISLVRVSGKGNFRKFRRFFEAFGVEVKLAADVDALFEGYQHLGAPEELTAVRAAVIQAVDARVAALGVARQSKWFCASIRMVAPGRTAGWA